MKKQFHYARQPLNVRSCFLALFFICGFQVNNYAQSPGQVSITVTNNLSIGRLNQTIEIPLQQLIAFKASDYDRIHVRDDAGREILCQLTDVNGDLKLDNIIFQSDFAPNQVRKFFFYTGEIHLPKASEYKTYGRFVKERFDDFAWENDRIGQRVYGTALKTATIGGPLTSSAIDIWPKRTSKLIINDWYMTDHYHVDMGDGADLYVSGKSRGVGGDGLWSRDSLWVSENYTDSRVSTTGPVRVSFDLQYNEFDVNGVMVREEKNIALDAGQNLNHFTVRYKPGTPVKLQAAAGVQISTLTAEEVRKGLAPYNNKVSIERLPGAVIQQDSDKTRGWFIFRQPVSEGELFTAIIIDPSQFVKMTQNNNNVLVVTNLPADNVFSYWAGYTWTRSGQFKDFEEWKQYVSEFARRVQSPVTIKIN